MQKTQKEAEDGYKQMKADITALIEHDAMVVKDFIIRLCPRVMICEPTINADTYEKCIRCYLDQVITHGHWDEVLSEEKFKAFIEAMCLYVSAEKKKLHCDDGDFNVTLAQKERCLTCIGRRLILGEVYREGEP
jgi:hypothetical protein